MEGGREKRRGRVSATQWKENRKEKEGRKEGMEGTRKPTHRGEGAPITLSLSLGLGVGQLMLLRLMLRLLQLPS